MAGTVLTYIILDRLIDLLECLLLIPAPHVVLINNCLHITEPLLLPLLDLPGQLNCRFARGSARVGAHENFRVCGRPRRARQQQVWVLLLVQRVGERAILKLRVELHHVEVDEKADKVA